MVTATPPVRWGLMGTARINRHLVPAMRAASRSVITAVASRARPRADAHAREWDIAHAVEGYDTLLARDDVDAVYVPLPNSLHAEWTLRAIEAGKHVLCEKPLVTDPADVDQIREAAEAAGVVVEEGFMYRHEPLTDRVVALVSSGGIGEVCGVVSGFTYARNRAHDVRLSPDLGGGALLDVGCYPISYACLLFGSDCQTATGSVHLSPEGVDEECAGTLRFAGGRVATIYAGFRAAYRTWLDVLGSEGSLTVPNPFKPGACEALVLDRLGERRLIEVRGSQALFVR
ncbi:MAG: Gfo/Idh/MocA family oxidoreductase, partial [Acidobacteriota bacterium]|nr:Gfo/Idh/MocA family oxidoreductase [Acidobacteriota bacterium]